MHIPVARLGDSTTTGRKVRAARANIHDNEKKLALCGEHATSGNRKGSWPMFGTGDTMCNHGTSVVIADTDATVSFKIYIKKDQ